MARLIDADKLIANLKPEESVWVGLVLAEQVANAETVDAIPVEWIEKYKRVRGWEVTVTTQNAIDNMLNAWEKENDR